MTNRYYFNNIKLTKNSIEESRKNFYYGCLNVIDDILKGDTFLNNEKEVEYFIILELKNAKEYLLGYNDYKPYFLQYAYYIQTGESIPLMNN